MINFSRSHLCDTFYSSVFSIVIIVKYSFNFCHPLCLCYHFHSNSSHFYTYNYTFLTHPRYPKPQDAAELSNSAVGSSSLYTEWIVEVGQVDDDDGAYFHVHVF